jgi:RimJ/RimL family protein N-acetyltransferase
MPAYFTLEGRHVHLIPLGPEHVDELLEAAGGGRSTFAFTPVPWDRPSMTGYVERAMAKRDSGDHYPFVTWSVDAGRIVGSTRFYDLAVWDWSTSRYPSAGTPVPEAEAGAGAGRGGVGNPGTPSGDRRDAASIGYTWLHPSAQRTPVNSEAKLMMLDHAFGHWGTPAVRIQTDARNARSRAAIARLGFSLDGILRADKPAADGAVRDSAVFSMLADEWPEHRNRLLNRLNG